MATYYTDPLAYARPIPLVQAPAVHTVHTVPTVPPPAAASYGARLGASAGGDDDVQFDCTVSADAHGGFVAACVPRLPATSTYAPRTGRALCVVDPDRDGFEMDCNFE
ncbi:hypothetical protein psal_cds_473 [Pandoravirus salinus]|uniref:Uncharacterized protein n=1 Tax=Pandoravirus salinus TaxID=1349410 RepID=S4W249_9VIRU|nr:hypothetical protein psal_cds_473 [Pandoravirus salinus]AGO84245.1 hypothetical protein psal_cds_473 [Pandoravirus salinus]